MGQICLRVLSPSVGGKVAPYFPFTWLFGRLHELHSAEQPWWTLTVNACSTPCCWFFSWAYYIKISAADILALPFRGDHFFSWDPMSNVRKLSEDAFKISIWQQTLLEVKMWRWIVGRGKQEETAEPKQPNLDIVTSLRQITSKAWQLVHTWEMMRMRCSSEWGKRRFCSTIRHSEVMGVLPTVCCYIPWWVKLISDQKETIEEGFEMFRAHSSHCLWSFGAKSTFVPRHTSMRGVQKQASGQCRDPL